MILIVMNALKRSARIGGERERETIFIPPMVPFEAYALRPRNFTCNPDLPDIVRFGCTEVPLHDVFKFACKDFPIRIARNAGRWLRGKSKYYRPDYVCRGFCRDPAVVFCSFCRIRGGISRDQCGRAFGFSGLRIGGFAFTRFLLAFEG